MGFEALDAYLDSLEKIGIPTCDCMVCRNHELVHRHYHGFSDDAKTKPMNGHETYFFFSATKLFTCVSAMQLIEQGLMGLDDPVYRYLPSFTMLTVADGDITRAARTVMTVRHLMSMQSGLDYDIEAKAILNAKETYGAEATTQQIVDAIAHKPLGFDPGTDYRYSLSHDVLAAIIEVVSGRTFGEYLKEYIFEPLGISDIGFERTESRMRRMCALYLRDEVKGTTTLTASANNYILTPKYESGGAGLIGGVEDYALLTDALACGGIGKTGKRILREESIALLSAPQLMSEKSKASFSRTSCGYSYGLGVRVMVNPSVKNAKSPIGEFGWDGAAGAYSLVDPKNHLSLFHAQHVRGYNTVYFEVHPHIRDLVYEALNL